MTSVFRFYATFNCVKGNIMKTKLLPTMIGAILVGGMTAAAADVTVFGQIDESVVNNSNV